MNKVDLTHRMNDTKLLWHMNRVHDYYLDGKRISPLYIDMGVTKTCCAKCVYCYGLSQQMTGEMISRNALVSLFRDATSVGIKGIGLIGDGEPTCNPAIYEAMSIGYDNGLDIAISTNGILLNDLGPKINILRNCKWMRFNISAGTEEGYKKIHGVDKFNTVIKNVRHMVETRYTYDYDCEIGFQSVFVPDLMVDEVIPQCKLAIDCGIDYFVIKQCSLPDDGESGMHQFDLNEYDSKRVQDVLKQAESMSTEKTKIIVKWSLMELKGKRPYDKCLGIPLLLQISGNGKVYPCGYLFGKYNDKYLMGDIHVNSIKEIIESEQYWNVIKMMETEFDCHKDCKGNCRQDKVNQFIWEFMHPPKGLNFI